VNIEEIDIKDIEFGEPIEEREPTYRDGYIRGIYRARNIIDSKQKEIERLNNIINELEKYIRSNEWGIDYEHSNCRTHLLDILKGSDK
jgi:hypothetical protein